MSYRNVGPFTINLPCCALIKNTFFAHHLNWYTHPEHHIHCIKSCCSTLVQLCADILFIRIYLVWCNVYSRSHSHIQHSSQRTEDASKQCVWGHFCDMRIVFMETLEHIDNSCEKGYFEATCSQILLSGEMLESAKVMFSSLFQFATSF